MQQVSLIPFQVTPIFSGEPDCIRRFPSDILLEIFNNLKIADLQNCGKVCRRWHFTIFNHLARLHPNPSLKSFGLGLCPLAYVSIANRYGDKLGMLDLKDCFIDDAGLAGLNVKFSCLRINNQSGISSQSIPKLISQIVSPLTLEFSYNSRLDVKKFLNACNQQGIRIQELDLHECREIPNYNSNWEEMASPALCTFIGNGGLQSPCRLNLSGQAWVNRSVCNALIANNVKLSYLNIEDTPFLEEVDVLNLIQEGVFENECEIVFDGECPPNNAIVAALIENQIKLNRLYLTADIGLTSENAIVKFIHNSLQGVCEVDISLDRLTPAVVTALINSKVTIKKLKIWLRNVEETPERKDLLSKLMTQPKFQDPFVLEVMSNLHTNTSKGLFSCLNQQRARISALLLHNVRVFPFLDIIGKFVKKGFSLSIRNAKWDYESILPHLWETKIRCTQLIIEEKQPVYCPLDFGALEECEILRIPHELDPVALAQVAKLPVVRFSCSLPARSNSTLINLLKDKHAFRVLEELVIKVKENARDIPEELGEARPSIRMVVDHHNRSFSGLADM